MARPRSDGTPSAAPDKRKLSEIFIRRLGPKQRPYMVWDAYQRGLALLVQPTGFKSWKCVYHAHGRPRWFHIGAADAIGLADARRLAGRVMFAAAEGKDPQAERQAERGRGTFAELAARYLEEHAKRHNKSWKQADALARKHLLPRWGKLAASAVTRADVKTMMASIAAPIMANQTLAAASAIFSWGMRQEVVKANPCRLVDRNSTTSRDRVLSDAEIPTFWAAFDSAGLIKSTALKFILLTGQRPGEVANMRKEHIVDGWWELPGDPVPALGWPGTKNGQSHRVWLPAAAKALIEELDDGIATGFVFTSARRDLGDAMRDVCDKLRLVEKESRATPHDLRRSHGTWITRLGFGRDAMNRIQNHREGGIASVYDRHQYAEENRRIMETVASGILALVEGTSRDNVVRLQQIV
jgi:integrase